MCNAEPVMLNATGGVAYVWSPATGLSTPTSSSTVANPMVTTTYTVVVTDSVGCIDSDRVTVAIAPSSGRVIATPADTSICDGGKLRMNASGAATYQWTPAEGLDNPATSNPWATVTTDIMYVVKGTDTAGCTSTDTVTIHRRPLPSVDATAEGIGSKCESKSVLLKATGSADSYQWTPDTYVINKSSNTTYAKPSVTTLYTVTGTGTNGCVKTDTVTAFVHDEAVVMMPDAFSPNGDNRNDMMHPMAFCDYSLDEYRIYDRWGQEVFISNSLSGGWNGNRDGVQADMGTYHYVLIGRRTSTNEKIITKGTFILIR
jgi:gliding motility-associated-like protein